MNWKDLTYFKELLTEKRTQANDNLKDLQRFSRSDDGQESSEDRSAYSLHMADRGTDAIEREKTLLLAQREGSYIDYLNEALQRLENGSFGVCRDCCGEIGRARLEAVPIATQCIECKSKDDIKSSWTTDT